MPAGRSEHGPRVRPQVRYHLIGDQRLVPHDRAEGHAHDLPHQRASGECGIGAADLALPARLGDPVGDRLDDLGFHLVDDVLGLVWIIGHAPHLGDQQAAQRLVLCEEAHRRDDELLDRPVIGTGTHGFGQRRQPTVDQGRQDLLAGAEVVVHALPTDSGLPGHVFHACRAQTVAGDHRQGSIEDRITGSRGALPSSGGHERHLDTVTKRRQRQAGSRYDPEVAEAGRRVPTLENGPCTKQSARRSRAGGGRLTVPEDGAWGRAMRALVVGCILVLAVAIAAPGVAAHSAESADADSADAAEGADADDADSAEGADDDDSDDDSDDEPEDADGPVNVELYDDLDLDHLEELEAERDEAEQRAEDAAAEREAAQEQRGELLEELEAAADRAEELGEERDEAEAELAKVQERLDRATQAYEAAVDRLTELEAEIAALKDHIAELDASMDDRRESVNETVRELYKRGGPRDSTNSVFAADGSTEALRAAGYLRTVQHGQRSVFEGLGAQQRVLQREQADLAELKEEQRRVAAETEEARAAVEAALEDQEEELAERQEVLASAQEEEEALEARVTEVEEELEALADAEDEAGAEVAATEEAIQEELERLAREHQELEEAAQREREERLGSAARDEDDTSTPGPVACPVGEPRSFVDSYGAPRSGGRSHKGTDIMAPRDTPIYAYESGRITRMTTNRLGGITLNLRGESGKRYYYAHLDGYVDDLSTGQRVDAGEHIAYNGDTGNARGTPPHLHIEVRPGGGRNVNPYPYMRGACG